MVVGIKIFQSLFVLVALATLCFGSETINAGDTQSIKPEDGKFKNVSKPHIFLVLADDFGWHNIGFRNPEIRSPNLDKMAKDGIILDRHYVFKYCSPTRSSLLSGRLPLHVNQNNECNLVTSKSGIDIRMTLLPEKMKTAGYATMMTGKWHLGARSPANLPTNRGFDQHLGFLKGGEDHNNQVLSDEGFKGPDLWGSTTPAFGQNGTFSTLIYGPKAVDMVMQHVLPQPLFMYLPFQCTHSPYEIPDGYTRDSDAVQRRVFNAMVNIMDQAVGNLTAALETKNMLDDTFVLFTADNGGVYHGGQLGNNFPLRGQKTSDWEGGVRATAFVWGGKNVLASQYRGTVNEAVFHIADWYATLLTLVGVDPSDNAHIKDGVPAIDGIDQWKTLMTVNATLSDSIRHEVPLSFCPLTAKTRGSDNCCPTDEAGGWVPNGTKLSPSEWRNHALIQLRNGSLYKMVYGTQFGFGVHTGPMSPNASGASHNSNDAGCPSGCLYDLIVDPNETNDISKQQTAIFQSMINRQQTIGLGVFQTNFSDVLDADCISPNQMINKYKGFLGPRCGVTAE